MVSSVPQANLEHGRNIIECPSTWKGTFDAGYLIPFFWTTVLPGDTVKLDTSMFTRLSTQVLPPMDNIYMDFHFWYVPDRLRWENWKKFIGERNNPGDSIDYVEPVVNSGQNGFDYLTNFDYIGCPPKVANYNVNSAIFRDLLLIWNHWYRDENLQNEISVPLGDGPDNISDFPLLIRGKRGDYFTTVLPYPQNSPGSNLPGGLGYSSGVTIPLGSSAPVYSSMPTGSGDTWIRLGGVPSTGGDSYNGLRWTSYTPSGSSDTQYVLQGYRKANQDDAVAGTPAVLGTHLEADLTSATSATINTLRQAIALQQFLERDMLNGPNRYVSLIWSHFNVLVPDATLQRPEFLGGTTVMVNTNVVPQTSSSDSTSPQGNLSAYSTASGTGIGFTRSFTEHGFIIGLVSARTDLTYQQGIDRLLTKQTRYDYYWNDFAHLGMQPVYNKEIYVQSDSVVDSNGDIVNDNIFGYTERYNEYRYKNSLITGLFRSSHPQSLQNYHYAQSFGSLPQLNSDFIEVPHGQDSQGNYLDPIKRTLAVQSEPDFMMDCYFDLQKITEVSINGTPGLLRL